MRGKIVGDGARKKYLIDGEEVSKRRFDRAFPAVRGAAAVPQSMAYVRPVPSDALAVHPSQVNEAREDAVRKGVPTEFRRDGRPLIRSREHLRQYCNAYGFYHRDAGYGDAQRGGSAPARDGPGRPPSDIYGG